MDEKLECQGWVEYEYNPLAEKHFAATLEIMLPCNPGDECLHELLLSDEAELACEHLLGYWGIIPSDIGNFRCRHASEYVAARSWTELDTAIRDRISEIKEILRGVYSLNKRNVAMTPQSGGVRFTLE